ncbi:MAG: xanthine dehydrogenase family protein molybdopterin-binding subunit [Acidimicrobiia bacterium]|nr:xanthine dehydrogenase family protein molybdopterin-binding subunit [Acidimicrobiia bacterium]
MNTREHGASGAEPTPISGAAPRDDDDGATEGTSGSPFGERVPRKEDARLLTGRGRFVADVRLDGMLHLAFVRSAVAHARITGVDRTEAEAVEGVVAVAAGGDDDFAELALVATSALPSHIETPQPALAADKVRFQGEAVAAIVAADRYLAEDAAELVRVDYEELAVHVDPTAVGDGPVLDPIHETAPDNVLIGRVFDAGEVDDALARAELVLERTYRTNRHAGVPLEGRGAVAEWDPATSTLTLHVTSQTPHLHRGAMARALGLADHQLRLVVGDVGGGFGVKAPLYPEYLVVAQLARRLERPIAWIEDRVEHLQAAAHARDHHYLVRAGFDADGRLQVLDAVLHANVGAYSGHPWTAGLEPLMAGGLLTGPYKLEHYRCDVRGVATNTGVAGPYRGVARPATVFVMDRLLDDAAMALAVDPVEIRRRNLVGPDDLPYTAPTRLVHDSRTYIECLDRAAEKVDYDAFRAEQQRALAEGRYVGIGFACYNELTGLGQKASAGPRLPFRTGHECVTVRLDPSGHVQVLGGTTSQGQGLETTLAQVVAAELGVGLDTISVEMGDTGRIQYGLGAFASRQGVIGSGAATVAARAVADKILTIAAHLLEAEPGWLSIDDGFIHTADAPAVGVTVADVCTAAFLEPHRLPPGVEPGLEATRFYDPITGTFAAGAQVAVVEVDVETGMIELHRLVVVEDTGRMINPMIVEGQIEGAVAQGIGGTLYEHLIYDDRGQLLTSSLMDYLLPSSTDIPPIEVGHVADPADNLNGVRGVGEGGTLGPYAAIANAVCDALSPLGVTIDALPLSPSRVRAAIRTATP